MHHQYYCRGKDWSNNIFYQTFCAGICSRILLNGRCGRSVPPSPLERSGTDKLDFSTISFNFLRLLQSQHEIFAAFCFLILKTIFLHSPVHQYDIGSARRSSLVRDEREVHWVHRADDHRPIFGLCRPGGMAEGALFCRHWSERLGVLWSRRTVVSERERGRLCEGCAAQAADAVWRSLVPNALHQRMRYRGCHFEVSRGYLWTDFLGFGIFVAANYCLSRCCNDTLM